MTFDPFWWKFFIVVVLVAAQGVLWAWIGIQASRLFSWWPLDPGIDNVLSSSSSDQSGDTSSTSKA